MKYAPIAVLSVIGAAIFAACAMHAIDAHNAAQPAVKLDHVAIAPANDVRPLQSDAEASAEATQKAASASPSTAASPDPVQPVNGPHFQDNDAACSNNYDARHLAKLMRDRDGPAYLAYANENKCQWIKKGTPIYVESGVLDDGVIEVRMKGSTESLYTQSASITVFSDDADKAADPASAGYGTDSYDDAPVIKAEVESYRATAKANVLGTINHTIEACQSHGGECVTLQPGTEVILDVPSTDETTAWFEIANPAGDQPHTLVSTSSSAITLN